MEIALAKGMDRKLGTDTLHKKNNGIEYGVAHHLLTFLRAL